MSWTVLEEKHRAQLQVCVVILPGHLQGQGYPEQASHVGSQRAREIHTKSHTLESEERVTRRRTEVLTVT